MNDCFEISLPENDIRAISMLGLAHVGDAVYELLVRTRLCVTGGLTAGRMHADAVRCVSAPAQARAASRILPLLTPEEMELYKRGRNTRVHSVPGHATLEEYHAATGLEALFGALYLRGERQRIGELFDRIMEGEDD